MERPLIGLVGYKGAGKDTVARILRHFYGYQRQAWGDALKREVYNAFGRDMLLALSGLGCTYAPDFGSWCEFIDAHKYDAPDSEYGWLRPLLQFWGTEYRRDLCGQDYWVEQLTPQLGRGVVVTDCRLPNEFRRILDCGGYLWRVEGRGYTGDSHRSEGYVLDAPVQTVIVNDRGLLTLAKRVVAAVEELEEKDSGDILLYYLHAHAVLDELERTSKGRAE